MNWFLVALVVLACWRVTHLVTDDQFPPVAWLRDRITQRKPLGSLAYLVECTYCVSAYTGAAAAAALYYWAGLSLVETLFAWPAFGATTVALEKLLGED